jgi:hypothetical protein
MKLRKLKFAISAVALGLCLQANFSWGSRALSPVITGTVTAVPIGGSIEVDHRSYAIKPNSAAAKILSSFYLGEQVDIVVDGPPNGTLQVISIAQHQGP